MVILTRGLIVVDGDPLELKVAGAAIHASGVDAVLLRNDLPELRTNNTSVIYLFISLKRVYTKYINKTYNKMTIYTINTKDKEQ